MNKNVFPVYLKWCQRCLPSHSLNKTKYVLREGSDYMGYTSLCRNCARTLYGESKFLPERYEDINRVKS